MIGRLPAQLTSLGFVALGLAAILLGFDGAGWLTSNVPFLAAPDGASWLRVLAHLILLLVLALGFAGVLLAGVVGLFLLLPPRLRAKVPGIAVVQVPYLWLIALFLVPFLIVVKISLSDYALAIPPYTPTLDLGAGWAGLVEWFKGLDFENFVFLTTDDLYWRAYLSSLKIALISTFFTLLVGYPIAYGMSRAPDEWRPTFLMLMILPFWTSFLIRVYSFKAILAQDGFFNNLLMFLHIIDQPLAILNTNTAVYIGIVYTYLPFMVLPLYATLEKLDDTLLEAAEDLGCTRSSRFWLVTFPLSRPGIVAGSFLVFIPVMGEFVIPALLGGSDTLMIGKVLWEEFFSNRDWPVASAVAVVLLMILIIPIVLFQKNQEKQQEADR